jgi:hypothetical protein
VIKLIRKIKNKIIEWGYYNMPDYFWTCNAKDDDIYFALYDLIDSKE